MGQPPVHQLSGAAAATAAALRERFGFLRDVVSEMERSVPYASALVRMGEGTGITLRDGQQQANRLDPQNGVVLTASTGYSLEESATDALDPASIRAAAAELVERARSAPREDGPVPLDIAPSGPRDADFATAVERDPRDIPLLERVERFEAIRRRLREQAPRAVEAACVHRESSLTSVFVNRMGLATQQVRRAALLLQLFVSDGSERQFDGISRAGTGAWSAWR